MTSKQSTKKYIPVKFNIYKFLNYYKDPKNYSVDTTHNIVTNYYSRHSNNSYKLNTEPLTEKYITINGKKIYVKTYIGRYNIEHILFTIPKQDASGIWWDDHFHFGINKSYTSQRTTRKNKNIKVVFFHKTIQNEISTNINHINCFFEHKIDLNSINIEDIKCHSYDLHKMKDEFPITSEDFTILKEIIRRPFFGPHVPGGIGGKKKTRKNRKINKK